MSGYEKKKILIIEDEDNIRELVKYNLEVAGYEVFEGEDGIKGITMAYRKKPDLILLDIMLPEKNGYEICSDLRKEGNNTPIIMLTAKSGEKDKVTGLDLGADDYLVKPFGIGELLARVKAVLRRYSVEEGGNSNYKVRGIDSDIKIDDLVIKPSRHEVFVKDRSVVLTAKEFELLVLLASNPGIVFSRDKLLDEVWGIEYIGESRTVDVHIRNLRKKLDLDIIETIRSRGYRIRGA